MTDKVSIEFVIKHHEKINDANHASNNITEYQKRIINKNKYKVRKCKKYKGNK